jgi:hypothetical protein
MKLDIEITEEEIKSAVEREVRSAIADQTNQWGVDRYIKEQVAASWKNAVDSLVEECLNDSPAIREKIRAEVERKLWLQLAAVMRKAI